MPRSQFTPSQPRTQDDDRLKDFIWLFEIPRDEPGVLKRSFSPGNAFSEPGTHARRRMRAGPVCWTLHRPTRVKAALQHS
ncbi:MAG: hypothetical protein GY801_11090 [bacterium]|nr:hypothetical protein [bacterium]